MNGIDPPDANPLRSYVSSFFASSFAFLGNRCVTVVRFTPAVIFGTWFSAHLLGRAYHSGYMMAFQIRIIQIQFHASGILLPYIGYAGVGYLMSKIDGQVVKIAPQLTFLVGIILYRTVEKIILFVLCEIFKIISNRFLSKKEEGDIASPSVVEAEY